jgi:4-carboxymuconolactone decarboxylase
MPFGGYLLTAGTLSGRDRELLILRTALNCASPYEWGQHVRIAEAGGIDRETIDRVAAGPDAEGWSDSESPLLRAADELHADAKIGDDTWADLAKTYDEKQLIEIPMVVGQYHMVAFTLNSLEVEQDPGLEDLP